MSSLKISENKLERLQIELVEARKNLFDHAKKTNGQPMNDKRNYHSHTKKADQLEKKYIKLIEEVEAQNEWVRRLKSKEEFQATQPKTLDESIEHSRKRIEILKGSQKSREKQNYKFLVEMKEQYEERYPLLTDYAKSLIESGVVVQWKKRPLYFFVKGLKKVAVQIGADGNFEICPFYKAWSDQDKQIVNDLINK